MAVWDDSLDTSVFVRSLEDEMAVENSTAFACVYIHLFYPLCNTQVKMIYRDSS